MANRVRILSFFLLSVIYLYQTSTILTDYQLYPTAIDLKTEGHGTLKFPAVSMCITNWIDRRKFESKFPDVDLVGPNWRDEVLRVIRTSGNLADVAISSETHFQFGVSNPTFYFVEFYLKKSSISISYASLPTYMCFSLNWTGEASMQVVHQNPLIFRSSLLFFWVPENTLEINAYQMTVAFHDVDGSSAGERPGIILEPSGEYVFNLEQREIVYLPKPYDTMCTDYVQWPRQEQLRSILTKPQCYQDCKNQILLERCQCVAEDYAVRHWLNSTTCMLHQECQQRQQSHIAKVCTELCGKPCNNIIYEAKQAYSKVFDPLEEGEHYIKLILLMTSRNVDVMQFIPALSFTKMLGLLGGYLGLWLGLSLVTIFNNSFFFFAKLLVNRLRGSVYSILAINCLYRAIEYLCALCCLYACVLAIWVDTSAYMKYRTSVVVNQGNLSSLEFPALTICNNQAINFSRICWEYDGNECKTSDPEAILGNRLTLVKELIQYSYPLSELVLECQMKFNDFTCQPADCLNSWKLQYTYLKTGVCYTFDPMSLEEYRSCHEPWKFELSVRLATTSGKDVALSGFLHQQNTFTSGMPNTFMLRSGKIYMITAAQKTFKALPEPYETQCSDYIGMSERMNYTDEVIQAEECSERCLASKWEHTCNCHPKLYGARHRLSGNLCEYLSHLRCIQEMKDHNWLPLCQQACTRACYEIRYSTLSFTIGNLGDYLRNEGEETIVNARMGSTRAEITSNVPRITGSDLFTLLSGHVSMWLGISATMLFALLKYIQRTHDRN